MANNTLIQLPMMCARQGTLGFQLVVTFSCYHSRDAYVTKISNQADRHYPMTRSRVYENISRLIPTSLEKDLGLGVSDVRSRANSRKNYWRKYSLLFVSRSWFQAK